MILKPLEISENIKKNNADKLAKIDEKQVAFILREAYRELQKVINDSEDDNVHIVGLGKFKKRVITQKKFGKVTTLNRISFKFSKKK